MRTLIIIASLLCLGADWMTMPSYYTHRDGKRVTQFAPKEPAIVQHPMTIESGYHHTESVIGRDRLHITREWGRQVRPYGEWRFPYRPYSVPYPYWGPQPAPRMIFP